MRNLSVVCVAAGLAIGGCGKSQPAPPSPASAPSTMLPPAVLPAPAAPPTTVPDGPAAITSPQTPTPPMSSDVMQTATPDSEAQAQAETLLQQTNADIGQMNWPDAAANLKKLDALKPQLPQPLQQNIDALHGKVDPMIVGSK